MPGPAAAADPPRSIWAGPLRPATVALVTTIALVAFEGLAVAAAIPQITAELGRVTLTSWVLTSFFISSTVATLAAGPVIDQRGVRWTYDVALAVFVAASVGCALAPTMELLIAGRVVQGLGGGALVSSAIAAVGIIYPERLRARQYAAQSTVWGTMSVLGPAAAALFITTIGWPGVFWINLPLGACALALGHRSLPSTASPGTASPGPSGGRAAGGVDGPGLVLATAFIFGLIVSLSDLSARSLVWGAATAVAGVVWWVQAGRAPAPLVQRSHVAADPYRLIGLTIGFAMAAAVALNLFLPIVVRGSLGRSETAAAFSLLFFSLSWTVGAQVTSRLLDHLPGPTVAIGGLVVLLVGAAGGALTGTEPSFAALAIAASVRGLGIGCVSIPYLTELQRRAAGADFGRINAAHQFFRFVGLIVSIALVGGVMLAVVDRRTGDVEALRDLLAGGDLAIDGPLRGALADGYRWAQVVMAALAGVALGLGVLTRTWLTRHPVRA